MVPYDGLRGPGDVLQLSDCDLTASGFDSLNRHVWCSRAFGQSLCDGLFKLDADQIEPFHYIGGGA